MTNYNCYIYRLTILFSLFINTSFGEDFNDIKLDNRQPILNGRVFINFPNSAKKEFSEIDTTSSNQNINSEIIVLNFDKIKIRFVISELFKIADKNFLNDVLKEKSTFNFKTRILTNEDKLLSIISTPTVFDSVRSMFFINKLLIKTQDNSVLRIGVFVSQNGWHQKEIFIKLSERIFQTVKKGIKLYERGARNDTIEIYTTKKKLVIPLPADYSTTIERSNNNQLISFHKYTNYSDSNSVDLFIYFGYNPFLLFHDSYYIPFNLVSKTKGNFIENNNFEWLIYKNDAEKKYLKEQEIKCNNLSNGMKAHIAMISNNKLLIEDLTKIIESVKLIEYN
jgi:hypothetical protein